MSIGRNPDERYDLLRAIETPHSMSVEDELAFALSRVMRWPNPEGPVGLTAIPGWLREIGLNALTRYVRNG